ncbi:hypothetical protein vseg_003668 [Gypsophila vaccaria]
MGELRRSKLSAGRRREGLGEEFEDVGQFYEVTSSVSMVGQEGTCQLTYISVDAGWKDNLGAAVGWIVVRDGYICNRMAYRLYSESALQAEAKGLLAAILWAKDHGFCHLTVQTDCLLLVHQIAGSSPAHHQIISIIEDVYFLSSFFHCLCIKYIPRIQNKIAHDLAQGALRN